MNRKLRQRLTPVIAVVAALAAGLGMYLYMDARDRPAPQPTADNRSPEPRERPERTERERPERPDRDSRRPVADAGPDTINRTRPAAPFALPEDLQRFIVEGRVVTHTGAPIENARVQFVGEHGLRGVSGVGFSDGAGHYRFVAYRAGTGRSASEDRAGTVIATTPDGGTASVREAVIPSDPAVRMPDVEIGGGGVIEGLVSTPDGRAAPGVQVSLRSAAPLQSIDERRSDARVTNRPLVRTVFTDDRGMFKVEGLPTARYRITLDSGYEGLNTNAEQLELESGQSTFVQLTLRAENYIRGTVVDQTGAGVPGVTVFLRRRPSGDSGSDSNPALERVDPMDVRLTRREATEGLSRLETEGGAHRVTTDAQGRYGMFQLQDIEWTVVARLREEETQVTGVRINGPDTNITLQSHSMVSGRVVDAESGMPVTAYDVRIFGTAVPERDADPFARVALDRGFPYRLDGRYQVAAPGEGEFLVRVTAPGYATAVVEVKNFGAGESRGGVDLVLKPLCELWLTAIHDGRRLDLEPVLLLFEDRLVQQASTNEVGIARIPDVTPGTYEVQLVQADGTVLKGSLTVPASRRADIQVEFRAQ